MALSVLGLTFAISDLKRFEYSQERACSSVSIEVEYRQQCFQVLYYIILSNLAVSFKLALRMYDFVNSVELCRVSSFLSIVTMSSSTSYFKLAVDFYDDVLAKAPYGGVVQSNLRLIFSKAV